ncbi:hypothetical protein ACJX0J_037797, partial [Zea mays]
IISMSNSQLKNITIPSRFVRAKTQKKNDVDFLFISNNLFTCEFSSPFFLMPMQPFTLIARKNAQGDMFWHFAANVQTYWQGMLLLLRMYLNLMNISYLKLQISIRHHIVIASTSISTSGREVFAWGIWNRYAREQNHDALEPYMSKRTVIIDKMIAKNFTWFIHLFFSVRTLLKFKWL